MRVFVTYFPEISGDFLWYFLEWDSFHPKTTLTVWVHLAHQCDPTLRAMFRQYLNKMKSSTFLNPAHNFFKLQTNFLPVFFFTNIFHQNLFRWGIKIYKFIKKKFIYTAIFGMFTDIVALPRVYVYNLSFCSLDKPSCQQLLDLFSCMLFSGLQNSRLILSLNRRLAKWMLH